MKSYLKILFLIFIIFSPKSSASVSSETNETDEYVPMTFTPKEIDDTICLANQGSKEAQDKLIENYKIISRFSRINISFLGDSRFLEPIKKDIDLFSFLLKTNFRFKDDLKQALIEYCEENQDLNPRYYYNLGKFYVQRIHQYGHKVNSPKEYESAKSWYRKAAELNLAIAQYKLAKTCCFKDNFSKLKSEGIEWLDKAAQQKYPKAIQEISRILDLKFFTIQIKSNENLIDIFFNDIKEIYQQIELIVLQNNSHSLYDDFQKEQAVVPVDFLYQDFSPIAKVLEQIIYLKDYFLNPGFMLKITLDDLGNEAEKNIYFIKKFIYNKNNLNFSYISYGRQNVETSFKIFQILEELETILPIQSHYQKLYKDIVEDYEKKIIKSQNKIRIKQGRGDDIENEKIYCHRQIEERLSFTVIQDTLHRIPQIPSSLVKLLKDDQGRRNQLFKENHFYLFDSH